MTSLFQTIVHFLVLISVKGTAPVPQPRIVNGIPTTASNYPFIAALLAHWGEGYYPFHFCGGSIIRKARPSAILTAAHCLHESVIVDPSGYNLTVALYASDTSMASYSASNNYTIYKILGFVIHENYSSTTFDNDIAIMYIDSDLTNMDYLSTVSIPNDVTLSNECCTVDQDLQVVGYGHNESDGVATETLEYTDVTFMDRDQCELENNHHVYNISLDDSIPDSYTMYDFITPNMICVSGNNTDSCQGDSGGPLIIKDTLTQIGIVSWGFGCNAAPGVYTNVGLYYNWLIQTNDIYLGDGPFSFPIYYWMSSSPTYVPTKAPSVPTLTPTIEPSDSTTSSTPTSSSPTISPSGTTPVPTELIQETITQETITPQTNNGLSFSISISLSFVFTAFIL